MVELFLETPLELKIMILVFAVFGFGLCWATKRDELKTFNDRYKVDQKWRGDDK
tara:strand:+ start:347 stop:508 length:162 start_codon:yes stop_codon:yes gene_type:complete